jgi:hypothetical protein
VLGKPAGKGVISSRNSGDHDAPTTDLNKTMSQIQQGREGKPW